MKKVNSEINKSLVFVIPPASDNIISNGLNKLSLFLQEKLKIKIKFHKSKNYEEAIKMLLNGSAHIGWLGSLALKEASTQKGKYRIESFAVGVKEGKDNSNYRTVFIVKGDSKIKNIKDIKDKKIVLSDNFSTSGYNIPKIELIDADLDISKPNSFSEVLQVKNHDAAIKLVISGKVDCAPISSMVLDEMILKGELNYNDIKIIHQSKDIPSPSLVFSSILKTDIKDRIKHTVLDAHNYIELGGYGGKFDRYIDPKISYKKFLESYLRPQWGIKTLLSILIFLIIYSAIFIDLEVNLSQLVLDSFNYLNDIIGRMFPPDFSNFSVLFMSMIETIEIAMLGTLLAILLSIPIGLLSARNLAPNYTIFLIARTITIFFRAIPEFIMAMILVIAIGFGAMPGVIALGFHTMGFLAKFYAEAIEHIDEGPIDALKSMGASKSQVISFGVIPQIMPSFIGNNLYILDRNIRMATMLGIVGAGGIGYELQSSFRLFNYPRVSAIIIVIFITIFIIDNISSYIRSKVN